MRPESGALSTELPRVGSLSLLELDLESELSRQWFSYTKGRLHKDGLGLTWCLVSPLSGSGLHKSGLGPNTVLRFNVS